MALDPKAQKLLEAVYPGLIAKLQTLGPGKFLDDYPAYRINGSRQDSVTDFSANVRYGFDDSMLVRISDSLEFINGNWISYHHAYHCGPDHRDIKNYYFRIDLDEMHDRHVHLKNAFYNGNDPHIPVSLIEPSVLGINPYQFLDLVHKFRSTKRLPLRMKRDKK